MECSKLHVDANALKDMMMDQGPVGVEASTVSPEGVPHTISSAHTAKLGIKVSDSIKVKGIEQAPSIVRKPKPGGAPPPPPEV